MNRRGLTLIELLLAIGLVLILGALVLPSIFTSLGERSFESAAEVVRNQLLLARAHAQVTRRPVEVMYENRPPRKPGVRARYFLIETPDIDTRRDTRRAAGTAGDPLPIDEEATDPARVIVEGWADRDLPDGLRVTDRSESDTVPGSALAPPPDGDDTPAVVRLAVYMPDGSAPLAQRVWIRDTHGRRGAIEVNPWTGLPSFERLAAADEAEADEETREPEAAPDPIDEFRVQETPPPAGVDDPEPAPDEAADPEPAPDEAAEEPAEP